MASKHVGELGEVITVVGWIRALVGRRPTMHIIEDANGNQFVWRGHPLASGVGARVALRAVVAEHITYRDRAQTVLHDAVQQPL